MTSDFSAPHHLRAALSSAKRLHTQLDNARCCRTSPAVRMEIRALLLALEVVTTGLYRLLPRAHAAADERRVA